jgi:hypothetical protein
MISRTFSIQNWEEISKADFQSNIRIHQSKLQQNSFIKDIKIDFETFSHEKIQLIYTPVLSVWYYLLSIAIMACNLISILNKKGNTFSITLFLITILLTWILGSYQYSKCVNYLFLSSKKINKN